MPALRTTPWKDLIARISTEAEVKTPSAMRHATPTNVVFANPSQNERPMLFYLGIFTIIT